MINRRKTFGVKKNSNAKLKLESMIDPTQAHSLGKKIDTLEFEENNLGVS